MSKTFVAHIKPVKEVSLFVRQGLLSRPLPEIAFRRQEFDMRQYWLTFYDGTYTYHTSMNISKWRRLSLSTKLDFIRAGLLNLQQGHRDWVKAGRPS